MESGEDQDGNKLLSVHLVLFRIEFWFLGVPQRDIVFRPGHMTDVGEELAGSQPSQLSATTVEQRGWKAVSLLVPTG